MYEKYREIVKRGEGAILHLYLDSVGKVTVGVGNMLPDVNAALQLPFINRGTRQPATPQEIEEEFNEVSRLEPGRIASWYKQFTFLELPEMQVDFLLNDRLVEFDRLLHHIFPEFDDYPESVKLGLMDMIFNLGPARLVSRFPKFTAAAKAQDWATCAAECNRPQLADERNAEVKGLFLECTA